MNIEVGTRLIHISTGFVAIVVSADQYSVYIDIPDIGIKSLSYGRDIIFQGRFKELPKKISNYKII